LRLGLFTDFKKDYLQFTKAITRKEVIKDYILQHSDINAKQKQYENAIVTWWTTNHPKLEALPTQQNVFDLYRDFSKSIAADFSALGILDLHKSRGAFAAYWESLETDLKSVAASGWNAELIPAEEILQSQFPEVLEELNSKETRRDELEAQFKEVNEIEEDDYNEEDFEVFPKKVVQEYKATLKTYNGEIKGINKDIKALTIRIKASSEKADLEKEYQKIVTKKQLLEEQVTTIETKLANHSTLEKELVECKKVIKEIKDKKDDLVEKAREKITPEEAKVLIMARWKTILHSTVMEYVNRYERELIVILEGVFTKYCETLTSIVEVRDQVAIQLDNFLKELGYEG
jgi:type I restriction enzyme M protein